MMDSPGGLLVPHLLNRALSSLLFIAGLLLARAPLIRVYVLLFFMARLHVPFSSAHRRRRGLLVGHSWAVPTASYHPIRLLFA